LLKFDPQGVTKSNVDDDDDDDHDNGDDDYGDDGVLADKMVYSIGAENNQLRV